LYDPLIASAVAAHSRADILLNVQQMILTE
jgi:hypothetical protein